MSVDHTRVPGIRYGEFVERRAARQPEQPAILFQDTTVTYRELVERITGFHAALLAWGVRPGDRVLCMAGNRPEILVALFATARCGAIFVPVNPAAPAVETAALLRDSTPKVALAEDATRGVLEQAVRMATQDSGGAAAKVCDIEGTHPAPDTEPAVHPVGADDPAQIVYTSGTTGTPKGVVLTHGGLFWNQINALLGLDVASDEVTLVNSPMFHVAGLNTLVITTLYKGGTVVIHRGFDAVATLDAIPRHGVTALFAVPTMLSLLSRHESFAGTDLSSLRWMLVGGAPVPPEAVTTWGRLGVPLLASYGLSEAGPSVSFRTLAQAAARPESSGPPGMLTELGVVGPDGAELAVGEVGELVVRGPHLAAGYWNRPQATDETFRSDGLRTGDRGLLDPDGAVVITGRQKDLIITGGENVDPVEVELAVATHPGVAEAVVIGVDDPLWGECVTAVIVPAGPNPPDLPELREYLSTRIARYKMPKLLETVEGLPRTSVGKIRRADVRRMLGDHPTASPTGTP